MTFELFSFYLSPASTDLQQQIQDHKGTIATELTSSVSYLVTTDEEVAEQADFVKQAQELGLRMVNRALVVDSIKQGKMVTDESAYIVAAVGSKRKSAPVDDVAEDACNQDTTVVEPPTKKFKESSQQHTEPENLENPAESQKMKEPQSVDLPLVVTDALEQQQQTTTA